MGFRTTRLGERVSVDTRKMSNGESELFEFDEDTKPYFVDYTLTDFIVKMINEKRITTAQIADLSNLEPNYINKLRIGQIKKPSRDKLLQLAFGLSFTEDETQLLFRLAGLCALYPRFKRDYIIMTCIRANKSIWECNDYLIENGVDGVVTEE